MREEDQAPITRVLRHYFGNWNAPNNRREWNPCLCPSHKEENPSAAVSYEYNAIRCLACGFKGNHISITQKKEGVTRGKAIRIAEEISGGSGKPVPQKSTRITGRRTFGGPRVNDGRSGKVPPWLR